MVGGTTPWSTAWSVGRLLSLRWPYTADMTASMTAALERGVAAHAACEDYDKGEGYAPHPDIAPYLSAWKDYTRHHTPSWNEDGVEHEFDSGEHGFHGIIDRLGSVRGDACVELKTSARGGPSHPRTAIQLAAYTLAYYGRVRAARIKRLEVQLRADGTYKLYTHDNLADFAVLDALLEEAHLL